MFARTLESKILKSSQQYKVLALIGPRQSGKTTLAKKIFPNHAYHTLENPDTRLRAIANPRSFLDSLPEQSILDEIQNTPDLFLYLQEIVDDKSSKRKFRC